MFFSKLSDIDKERIDYYRKCFACPENPQTDPAPLSTILAPWNEAKQDLFRKFGEQFIIQRKVEFEEDYRDILRRIECNLDCGFTNSVRAVYKDYNVCWWDGDAYTKEKENIWSAIRGLTSYDALAKNKYEGRTTDIPLKDGSTIRVQEGCKPMRILGKIADSYGIEGFEEFRNAHSLALNTKKLSGDLCLSIHPLDYMTMSDNESNWCSCMSWKGNGEYKQGTVEMMNSPQVVVGYLASSKPYHLCYGNNSEERLWNDKKWRCLFIVDNDFIISIKQYPYGNKNLVRAAISEIAKTIGWGDNLIPVAYDYERHYGGQTPAEIDGHKVGLEFATGAMYNDFGSTLHYILLNPELDHDIDEYDYCYSGKSECMWCGTTCSDVIGYDFDTSALCCENCDEYETCACCENRISPDDVYRLSNGTTLCYYCYEEYTEMDITDECYYWREEVRRVYLSTSNKEPKLMYAESIYVLPEHIGNDSWNKLFKATPQQDKCGLWYLYSSQCTEKGLRAFEIYDIEEYIEDDN